MRRRQYVGGHYRTSKTGKTYWVNGHTRNDYGSNDAADETFFVIAMLIAGFFTFGISWLALIGYFALR